MSRILHWTLGLAILWGILPVLTLQAQQLTKLRSTDRYTEYEFRNDSLNLDQPFEFPGYLNDQPPVEILSQVVRRVPISRWSFNPQSWKQYRKVTGVPTEPNSPLIEQDIPGYYRGRKRVSLRLHVVRSAGSNEALVTQRVRFRVFDKPADKKEKSVQQIHRQAEPLSAGQWYKIPILESNLYQLDADYLEDLEIPVQDINPQHLQVWAMRPDPLPHPNDQPVPNFRELPVLREGTGDGSLDDGDRILFWAAAPHRVKWDSDATQFTQQIHPYSDTSYVFLKVGSSPGVSAHPENYSGSTVNQQHSTFNDFRWMEEERHKPEEDLKSGLEWLGDRLELGMEQVVFRDTLSGLSGTPTLTIQAKAAARSIQSNRIEVFVNGQLAGTLSPSQIFSYTSPEGFAARTDMLDTQLEIPVENGIVEITMRYQSGDSGARAWVDWIRVFAHRPLQANSNQLRFYAPPDGSSNSIDEYILRGFNSAPYVLNVSDPTDPLWLEATPSGDQYQVRASGRAGEQFWATTQPKTPPLGSMVENQQVKSPASYPNYIIVTSQRLLSAAQEWANYRQQNDQLTPVVVTQQQLFNAFSGGTPDVVAIRNYLRHLDQRALQDNAPRPEYLLLLGDTSFDYKNILGSEGRPNLVFTYQSEESYSRVSSYGSDDFFGLLDDQEGNWDSNDTSQRLDIGIGRLPVQSVEEAQAVMEKWRQYESPSSRGSWRTEFTFAADDDLAGSSNDRDLHTLNAEGTAERLNRQEAGIRFNKIYELSYPAEFTPEGRRMPQASRDFIRAVNDGSLVLNYSGHGAERILSGERLFVAEQVRELTNQQKPTIFVTATCSFGRYDDPDGQSGAEELVLWPQGGATAAFTTTRVVYTSSTPTSSNFGLNIQLSQQMITRDSQGRPQRLGDIMRNTKNTSVGASFNSRKFILLGDPVQRIGLPEQKTEVTELNNASIATQPPDSIYTLPALSQAQIGGNVLNWQGNQQPSFQGRAQVTVMDADRYVSYADKSWAPSCYLPQCRYRIQNDVLFSGPVSVQNGQLSAQFIIPEDISYSDSTGRVLMYAQSTASDIDATGSFERIRFQGINENAPVDQQGPEIDVYLNDETFLNGALVNDSPTLIVELFDQSGINTTGNGIGHEIIATIDTQPEQKFVLNKYYESTIDSYQEGRIEYPIESLPEGSYELNVEAWDVYNNPSEQQIQFQVAASRELAIQNVFNYPNPMYESTEFVFEHNQPGQLLEVEIRLFTLSGRPVERITTELVSAGGLARIPWNGRAQGQRLATGTYLYHIQIKTDTENGRQKFEKIEKLVIIN